MDSEKKLDELYKLAKSNNEMIQKLYKRSQFAFAWGILKILIIVALAYGSWVFLQPYIDILQSLYQNVQSTSEAFSSIKINASDLFNAFSAEEVMEIQESQ